AHLTRRRRNPPLAPIVVCMPPSMNWGETKTMRQTSTTLLLSGTLATLLGSALLGAAGCGEQPTDLQTIESAVIAGGWTSLTLKNGWTAQGGTTPAIGV